MGEKALMVFTAKSRETIIANGGTSRWVLNPGEVRNFEYAVCTRNAHRREGAGTGPKGPEEHGSAFMVGRISDVRKVGDGNGRDRFLVVFDAVAELDVKGVWDGSRNPVRYVDVAYLKSKDIDFAALEFVPLETPPEPPKRVRSASGGGPMAASLSIAEAKLGLAARFGVPVDAIEITIKG